MGRDKAPKARQTTNIPSTTLITSSPALSWREGHGDVVGGVASGGGSRPDGCALIAQ